MEKQNDIHLKKVLKPIHLWAIAVGLVISGQFYGFSYGYATGGPVSFLVAFIPVSIFYFSFIFCYTELAASIPHAGGPSAYTRRALGPFWGFLTGFSMLLAFLMAPCAISLAVGAVVNFLFPALPAMSVTMVFLIGFILIATLGVQSSAIMELVVTILSLLGLLLFYFLAAPHFEIQNVVTTPMFTNGFWGVCGAVTFAMWLYFAVEGAAMSAEEMENPKRDIPKAYIGALVTLGVTALITSVLAAGAGDYMEIAAVDFPLTQSLSNALGPDSPWVNVMAVVGLIGLTASMIGCVLGYSRQCYAMARTGYLPEFLSKLNPRFKTPHFALIVPGIIAVIVALSGLTAVVITISVFAALGMYVLALISIFVLHKKEPNMDRPYKVAFPITPIISMISLIFIVFCVVAFNLAIIKWVLLVYAIAIVYYFLFGRKRLRPYEEEFDLD
ncbi:MAG: ethanolamine permease [Peptostreptococcaceae bacterium]|nr:ethanolamine permease [Peptostreptococcaceae bacterium]